MVCGLFTAEASLVAGHRLQGMQASVTVAHGSVVVAPGAQLLRGVWDLPGSGIEPVSPASSG